MGQKMCKKGTGRQSRKDDKREYGTLPEMAATIVEEFVFKVDFIGTAILTKEAAGLPALQKPLKELYIENVKKAGSNPRTQTRHLKIRPEGMLMTFRDGTGQTRHAFYDIASIHYFEAVKFNAIKGSDKKIRGIFEPLSYDTKMRSKLAPMMLDKKYAFLTDHLHPPMFTCVIRDQTNVKALDCLAFIATNDNEALQMASLMATNKYRPRTSGSGGVEADASRNDSVSSAYRPSEYSPTQHPGSPNSHSSPVTHSHSQLKYELRDDHFRSQTTDFDKDTPKDDGYLYPYPNNNDPSVVNHEVTRRYDAERNEVFTASDRTPLPRRPLSMDEFNPKRQEDVARPRFVSDESPTYRQFDNRTRSHKGGYPSDESITEYRPFHVDQASHKQHKHPLRETNSDSFGPVCSMSNIESRQEQLGKSHPNLQQTDSADDVSKPRPVAKVPPHVVAGVKVLPTEFKIQAKRPTPEQSPRHDRSAELGGHTDFTSQDYTDNIRYHVIDDSERNKDESREHQKKEPWREQERHFTANESGVTRDRHSLERQVRPELSSQSGGKAYSSNTEQCTGKHYFGNHEQDFAAYAAKREMVHNPYNMPDTSRDKRQASSELPRYPLQTSYSANPTYAGESWTAHNNSPSKSQKQHAEHIGFSYLSMNESPRRTPDHDRHPSGPRPVPRPTSKYDVNNRAFDAHKEKGVESPAHHSSRAQAGSMEQSLGYFP